MLAASYWRPSVLVVVLLGAYHLHKPTGWKKLEHEHKAVKFDQVEVWNAIKYIQIFWTDQKRLNRLKSQPIFSEYFQTEWREPFGFSTEISGFPL